MRAALVFLRFGLGLSSRSRLSCLDFWLRSLWRGYRLHEDRLRLAIRVSLVDLGVLQPNHLREPHSFEYQFLKNYFSS